MITLIHGDDIAASRNYYFDLKQQAKESVVIDGVSVALADLQQALSGEDLFGQSKEIFIENLVSKRKSPKELDIIIQLIIHHSSLIITLWESKEISKKQLQLFGNITIKQFRIPAAIFAFLDALKPHNGKQLIQLFHETLADKDAEFVLVMLQRQIRILLAIGSEPSISEVSRLASWQKGKLEKQAKLFSTNILVYLHNQLFDLEKNMKTGQLSQLLEYEIDFLLLSI